MKTILTPKLIKTLFWCIYIPVGLWACQQVGISWDEGIELNTYKVNLEAILGVTQGDLAPYQALLAYGDRYYGVGFHIPANLLSFLIETVSPISADLGSEARRITLNHIAIFLSWVGSGYLVGQILKRVTQDAWISTLGMIACLLWPYLLGHGLMNIKDIPFLFAWLLCTNQLLFILSKTQAKSLIGAYTLLGIFTGWLISIRISGVLISLEYLAFLLIFWSTRNKDQPSIQTQLAPSTFSWRSIGIFLLATSLTLFVCYPILWHNPLELLNAISYMSRHPWDGDTLTAGRFIAGTQLPWYIAAWLAVKLPLIAILGLVLCPIALYKLIRISSPSQHTLQKPSTADATEQSPWNARAIAALLLTVSLILLALVIKKVSLYNELRQILFIFPLLWIVAISSLRWINRKFTLGLLLSSIALFSWDNLKLFPYQYVYFNEIARQFPIATQYEKDYFGLSSTQSARWLNQNIQESTQALSAECVYVSPLHLWQYTIDNQKVACSKDFSERPQNRSASSQNQSTGQAYWIGLPVRDKVKALPIPNCTILHSEERILPLSSQTLVMSELYTCRP
ncbi:hypothetical protein [Polynucleobacter sp. AP-Melu-500A-A1]|uniref:hypothetical protein n=1 Tax=Polynucleobacter sp. AP-Melu-500A-A1 TaxID=2576929 RepID=UPI001C0B1096|nr:hypothetical protein [Polynucleobacter sp. AP-Melu-500A-A1]MBU3630100.1 hypothetical protein [Polynucleobacter sp. AP-Melu-500A-A1]